MTFLSNRVAIYREGDAGRKVNFLGSVYGCWQSFP